MASSNGGALADAETSTSTRPTLTMETIEKYLFVIKKRAFSTVFMPLLAISVSLLITGHAHIVLDWMLVPSVNLVLRVIGTALGIGLGLGLATHVHDRLELWQERHERNGLCLPPKTRATSGGILLRKPSNSHSLYQDETSYSSLMTSAGYDVSDGVLRGQIVKRNSAFSLQKNYEYTHVAEEQQNGPLIMKQQWPHLPEQISHEIGRWMEHIVRDYVAIWYSMIDGACPYQDERERRRMIAEEQQENGADEGNVNGTENDESHDKNNNHQKDRQMIFTTAPHRSLPLMTAMYHSMAIVLGNLCSRVEHVNVFSLVLLKFTRVLTLKLKTFRELRVLALEKSGGGGGNMSNVSSRSVMQSSIGDAALHDHDTTTAFDEYGNGTTVRRKQRRPVSEMSMTKEFLLAGKLHKAVTFGMDVPSLLFADASGKECLDGDENEFTEEQVLEQRLFDSNMMAECEQDYNRVLGHRLCRALLPRTEFSSPIIRTLMTELMAGCVLSPIMGCFAPDYVNSWISTGLEAVASSSSTTPTENSNDAAASSEDRTWDYDDSGEGAQIEVELDAAFPEDTAVDRDELNDSGLNEAIEVIRNPTNADGDDDLEEDEDLSATFNTDDHQPGHDSQTVSGDYILPLLTMAIIDLQRFVDFEMAREATFDPDENGISWDDEACQDAVRQVVLVIEAALIHGRRRQRLTKRKQSVANDDETRRDHEGDTLLPFFSSNLSQVLMELTSDIDAFETRIAKEETRLKHDQSGQAKKSDGPSMSCKPSMSELSTLRTLIAAWLHTGQVYKTLSVLIQARQSILAPYFHEDAFLRSSDNGAAFVSQLRALDRVEIMVDTTSILASSTLDADGNCTITGSASPQKKAITIQASSPTGSSTIAQPSPRMVASSLSLSMARGGERLQRFMSGTSTEEAPEYGPTTNASMSSLSEREGPTPRYLDFHRNMNFASSLRTERERRSESWQHVSDSMTDQSLKIVHRVKGADEEDMENHRDLHRLSRNFYSGTNTIGLKDGTRRKHPEANDSASKDADASGPADEGEVVRVSLLTVEMVGTKRRIEIPDDDSSFLIRAQVRQCLSISVVVRTLVFFSH